VADLKDRLLFRLKEQLPELADAPEIMEMVNAQLEVDVVF